MLEGITAFVTGGSRGIGQSIAVGLAENNANVTIAARSDGIHETADLIDDEDKAHPVELDVTDESAVQDAINETVETFGGLDCLINNAGIAGPTAPIEEITKSNWQKTIDVNLTGMFLTTKHSVPYLRQSDNGTVINISSVSGKRPLENRTPYTASKMGVIGLTRTLAFELGTDDITVNAICPGPVEGERLENVINNMAKSEGISYEDAKRDLFSEDLPLDEIVQPEDIAEMVAFLTSEKGNHITAQDINIDSGTTWY